MQSTLALFQTIATLILFGLFLGIRSLLKSDLPKIAPEMPCSYEVFHKYGSWLALRLDQSFQSLTALFYAGFFYLWTPILVFRYGWSKAALLVLLPFAGIPIAALIASHYAVPSDQVWIGMVLVALIRCMLSIRVGICSVRWKREAKITRGWIRVGQCTATGAAEAIRVFNPPAPRATSTKLFGRLRKYFKLAQ